MTAPGALGERRPAVVTAAVAGMLLLIALGLVNSAVALIVQDDYAESAAALEQAQLLDYVVIITIFASLVPSVLFAVLAAFVLHGRQWARVTTWVASGVLLLCGSCGLLSSGYAYSGVGGLMELYLIVYAAAVVVLLALVITLLALPPSNRFFARRRPW